MTENWLITKSTPKSQSQCRHSHITTKSKISNESYVTVIRHMWLNWVTLDWSLATCHVSLSCLLEGRSNSNLYIWIFHFAKVNIDITQKDLGIICIFVYSRANMHIWSPNINIWLWVDTYLYSSNKYQYLVSEYICAYICIHYYSRTYTNT